MRNRTMPEGATPITGPSRRLGESPTELLGELPDDLREEFERGLQEIQEGERAARERSIAVRLR
jgi:hypothetical protein